MAGVETVGNPFNTAGASHSKRYLLPRVFYAWHYSFDPVPLKYNRVIAVKIELDDLLPLSQISLLRAGDYGYDNNKLEIDTYNKLNNKHYQWVLDNILNSFFANQIKNSYNAVKDPAWPDVDNLGDFQNLPEHIRQECIEVHNLELLELSPANPDCPRHILREFFQIGFEDPSNSGFITQQQQLMRYNECVDVYEFPFSAFYDKQQFLDQLNQVATWAGIQYTKQQQIQQLHTLFLEKQPYKDSKLKCDQIVQQMINSPGYMPKLDLLEEAYINAMLRKDGHERRY
jgi:hypothetical protein